MVSRAEFLEPGDTLEGLRRDQAEEARTVEQDRENQDAISGGLFRGCFKDRLLRVVIRDSEDGVYRCPTCTWELEHGWCEQCQTEYDVEDDLPSITDLSDSEGLGNDESDGMMEHGPWGDLNSPQTDIDDISLDEDGRSVHAYDLDLEFAFARTAAQDLQGHQNRRRASYGGAHHHHRRGRTSSLLSTATTTDYSQISDTPHAHEGSYDNGAPYAVSPDPSEDSENSDDPDTDLDGFIDDGTETIEEDISLHISSDESSNDETTLAIQTSRRPIVELSDSDNSEDRSDDEITIRSDTSQDVSPSHHSTEGERRSLDASNLPPTNNIANASRKRRRIVTEETSDEDDESDPVPQRSHSRRRLSSDGSTTIGRQTPVQNEIQRQHRPRPGTQPRVASHRPRTSFHRNNDSRVPFRHEPHAVSTLSPEALEHTSNVAQPATASSVSPTHRSPVRTFHAGGRGGHQNRPIVCRDFRSSIQRSREEGAQHIIANNYD